MSALLAGLFLSLSLTLNGIPSYGVLTNGNPTDAEITHWTHYALTHDPRTRASEISVETRAGIVKLMGQVDNLAARTFAVAEAKKVYGVRGVIDEIDVIPMYHPDDQVAAELRRRLENSVAVDARNLAVTVHGGVATLSGEVPDWNQKEEARLLASEVRGVKDVVDNSHVHSGEGISDEESVRNLLVADPTKVPSNLSIKELVEDYIYAYHIDLFPVTDGPRLVGCISTQEVKGLAADEWGRRTVAELMVPCSAENTVEADTDALKALAVMNRPGHHRLVVRDGDAAVGVLTHKDMLKFLSIKMEIDGAN